MVGSSTGVFEFDSVVRGHHVYKTVWTPAINVMLYTSGGGRNEPS